MSNYREHPHIAFRNTNIAEMGERVAFVRGYMLAMAHVNGSNTPAESNAFRFGCEQAAADALNTALDIAKDDTEGTEEPRIDHALTEAAYAIRTAAKANTQMGVI